MSKMISLQQLVKSIDDLLRPDLFNDYAPNGLQIEGKAQVHKIVCGVTASQALIEAAIAVEADTLLVHHGYFWKNENSVLCGYKGKRIKTLMQANISLLAYHIPLDAHVNLGNNWQLGEVLRVKSIQVIKNGQSKPLEKINTQLMFIGDVDFKDIYELETTIAQHLGRKPFVIDGGSGRAIKRLAWCTGAAQDSFSEAISAGADAFLTGEVSERIFHESQETGVHFIAAGHHATERYGVQALGRWIESKYGVQTLYIDIENPV